MSETATTATPAAAPTPTTSAPQPSNSNSNSSRSMSTAEFRSTIMRGEQPPSDTARAPATDSSQHEASADPEPEQNASVDEQPTEQPTETSDYSWAEQLETYKDGLHGVALPELLQALASGQIPETLWDKFVLPLKDGDVEWTGTIADLRNGAQMQAKFTQNMQAFRAEEKAFREERDSFINYMKSWRGDETGESLLGGLEMLGMPVERMAEALANRLIQRDKLLELEQAGQLPAGTAEKFMQQAVLERKAAMAERKEARARAEAEAKRTEDQGAEMGNRVRTEAHKQFQAAGIKDLSPGLWNMFVQEITPIWQSQGTPPTIEQVRFCVQNAINTAKRFAAQAQAQKPAVAAPKLAPSAARPADPGAPVKARTNVAAGRMSTEEFRKQFGIR